MTGDLPNEVAKTMLAQAVFLDRDGTIVRDVHYCHRPEDCELLPGAAIGIRLLNNAGLKTVVVTNQSAVARGILTTAMLDQIHSKMRHDLESQGARLDGIYYCPHLPSDDCDCRKPRPKLLFRAASELGIRLIASYMVGDKALDIAAGKAVGCKTVLVGTGPSPVELEMKRELPSYVATGLVDAVTWIKADVASVRTTTHVALDFQVSQ